MTIPIQLSASPALRARAQASHSIHAILNRFVASLLAASAQTIRRSHGAIFPSVVHPLFELRKDRFVRDDGENA